MAQRLCESALARIRRAALEACPSVVRALAEGHRVKLTVLDPLFAASDAYSVVHECSEGSTPARLLLTPRSDQRYKHGDVEAAVRVFGGYCPECHALVAGAAVVDQRTYRSSS